MSYPLFADKRYRFLEEFTTHADKFYFLGDYGEVQGMFSSIFEATVGMVLYKFGIIHNFIEGLNLHVRSNYGLKSIDFRVFYVNSQGKLCSFLLEAHPWKESEISSCLSYTCIDYRKFSGINRPEFQNERYYYIQDEKELYKLIYFHHNHVSRENYDKKIINVKSRNILSFREKYLIFKKVHLEPDYHFTNSTRHENLLKLVPDKIIHRGKKISELELPDFVEFFAECETGILNAKISNPNRNFDKHVYQLYDSLDHNNLKIKFGNYRQKQMRILIIRIWLLMKTLTWQPQIHLRFLSGLMDDMIEDCRKYFVYNYYAFLSRVIKKIHPNIFLDEVNVRRMLIKTRKMKDRENYKKMLIRRTGRMLRTGEVSERAYRLFEEKINSL